MRRAPVYAATLLDALGSDDEQDANTGEGLSDSGEGDSGQKPDEEANTSGGEPSTGYEEDDDEEEDADPEGGYDEDEQEDDDSDTLDPLLPGPDESAESDPRFGGLTEVDAEQLRDLLGLDALPDLGSGTPFGPDSLGQLVNEALDALTPGGSGIQDFVDRLADGLQQTQGLSSSEARDLAQDFFDGLQQIPDDKTLGSDTTLTDRFLQSLLATFLAGTTSNPLGFPFSPSGPKPPSVVDLIDWARQMADRLMPPVLMDQSTLAPSREVVNAARKFAQDYAPLLDVLLGTSQLGRGTTGRTTQFEKSGGWEQANKDFDSLGLTNVQDRGNGMRTGQLPDGRTVTVRPFSSGEGKPTLEIPSGSQKGKVGSSLLCVGKVIL